MTTIKESFDSYWAAIWKDWPAKLPNENSSQYLETQKAFYAGAYSLMHEFYSIFAKDASITAGVFKLEMLSEELNHFLNLSSKSKD